MLRYSAHEAQAIFRGLLNHISAMYEHTGDRIVTKSPTAELPMSIGENIRQKRESAGMSQKTLAESLESGLNTVSGWEKDINAPPGDKVVAMAKLFGCSTDEILLERHSRDVTPEMRALFRRFNDLPDEFKHLARSMVGGMLASIEEEASRKHVA